MRLFTVVCTIMVLLGQILSSAFASAGTNTPQRAAGRRSGGTYNSIDTQAAKKSTGLHKHTATVLVKSNTTVTSGVEVSYQLPTTGPLPKTYRVSIAITAPGEPNWIVSNFITGAVRTVTTENQGRFVEIWNGLDDNYMPVPPGTYGIKGIYMPATQWSINGEYHTYTAKLVAGVGDSFFPTPAQDTMTPWIRGAGFRGLADVYVASNGRGVFYHSYLENSTNNFLLDFNQPIGALQILNAYNSGGAAGGACTASDGEVIWSESQDGGSAEFIYRADGTFGTGASTYRQGVYLPTSTVVDMAATKDSSTNARFLYLAENGTQQQIVVLDGNNATQLASTNITGIRAVMLPYTNDYLYALHCVNAQWQISRIPLVNHLPSGSWSVVTTITGITTPTDCARDAQGNFYICDIDANQVYKLAAGTYTITALGSGTVQTPGFYNPNIFMSPGRVATWVDSASNSHVLVVEKSGPQRVTQWSTNGTLERQWYPGMTSGCKGWTYDPADPTKLYVVPDKPYTGKGLVRYALDYTTGAWSVDAVWPNICAVSAFPGGVQGPRIINTNGTKYLGFTCRVNSTYGVMLYRQNGDDFVPSAGLVKLNNVDNWWNDENNDRQVQANECTPANLPGNIRYWGETWLDDLSFALMDLNGYSVHCCTPLGVDNNNNPVFTGVWTTLLSDTVYANRTAGTANILHGGNEVAKNYTSDWAHIIGSPSTGFYVCNTAGPSCQGIDTGGTHGCDQRLTYYAPNGQGGYTQQWRTGRKAFGLAEPGQVYGFMDISAPINGIIGVHDVNGLFHLYTTDGLYVDTILCDKNRYPNTSGAYGVSGELFTGHCYLNPANGKAYLALGRNALATWEIQGLTSTNNNITAINSFNDGTNSVTLTAAETSAALPYALQLRGGAGVALNAQFAATGGVTPALDGSTTGWGVAPLVHFQLDSTRTVDTACMYDADNLYFRTHLRLGNNTFVARSLAPVDRLFTHDRQADTVSVYFQGNPNLSTLSPIEGRAGDLRIIFAVVNDNGVNRAVALGMYPTYNGMNPNPITYISPVGSASYQHVGLISGATVNYVMDQDNKGWTIAACIPKASIPTSVNFDPTLRTRVDFSATLAGITKFWWSNADRSGSTICSDEPSEARFYPGAWSQATFEPDNGNLLLGVPSGSLQNGANGWTRTPTTDVSTYPPVSAIMITTEGNPPMCLDIRGTGGCTLTRTITPQHSENTISKWILTGEFFLPSNNPLQTNGMTTPCVSIKVADSAATPATIANIDFIRVCNSPDTTHATDYIKCNGVTMDSEIFPTKYGGTAWPRYQAWTPFKIEATNGQITCTIGTHQATMAVLNGSNWKTPSKLIFLFNHTDGFRLDNLNYTDQ